jgi:hypothetical protein
LINSSAGSDFAAVVNAVVDIDSSPFPFNFTLMQDDIDEEDEMFNLVLSVGPGVDASIAPGSGTATITITDEDCKLILVHSYLEEMVLASAVMYTVYTCLQARASIS